MKVIPLTADQHKAITGCDEICSAIAEQLEKNKKDREAAWQAILAEHKLETENRKILLSDDGRYLVLEDEFQP